MTRSRSASQPEGESVAKRLKMYSLAPEYKPEAHSIYVAAIRQALNEEIPARNIAVTGPYGTGKSSILQKIVQTYKNRVVEVSLSTLGDSSTAAQTNEPTARAVDAKSTTNLIQKEIVKQLLYLEKPSKTPQSRFNRISRPNFLRELTGALICGLIALIILFLTGGDQPILGRLSSTIPSAPAWSLYVGIGLCASAGWLGVRYLFRGRFVIEKLTAGPTSLTLSSDRGSYFDEYLDEIVYFFEISKRDIVIFEDIDRFDNLGIFEELRALNVLLNRAGQLRSWSRSLRKRKIKFVYAVKDSLFEKLELVTGGGIDGAQVELERADRTKFFDLVVPVVPFITHQNARDLMSRKMDRGTGGVSDELIRLVAVHIPDMRLIINIRNEFEIYRRQLLDHPGAVPDLTADKLFALVVYKHVYMSDFEKIRHGRSRLDDLYREWRQLVEVNLSDLASERARLRSRLKDDTALSERSVKLGDLLEQQAKLLVRSSPSSGRKSDNATIELDGRILDMGEIRTPEFWKSLVAGKKSINVKPHPRQAVLLELTLNDLANILGEEPGSALWEAADRAKTERRLKAIEDELEFLDHHTWKQLYGRSEFHEQSENAGKGGTFRALTKRHLVDKLPCDLVANGYIDQYFMLYVSSYYEEHLSVRALQYLLRNVDQGEPDPLYELTPDDIKAIIANRGSEILRDRVMLNVWVLDHLLAIGEPGELIAQLLGFGESEYEFIDHFVVHGARKRELIRALTPMWDDAFTYLAARAPVGDEIRLDLFDAALASWDSDLGYDLDDSVRTYIEANYSKFTLVTKTSQPIEVKSAVELFSAAGATLHDLDPLSPAALESVAEERVYAITAENLALISDGDDLALDQIRRRSSRVYEYATDSLDDYLRLIDEADTPWYSIADPDEFESVLDDVREEGPFKDLVRLSNPACKTEDIHVVPSEVWPALAQGQRFPARFANVAAYVLAFDGIDRSLAELLRHEGKIIEAAEAGLAERKALGIALVNDRTFLEDVETRVSLAKGLNLEEPLRIEDVTAESGPLIGKLIKEKLLEDSASSFENSHMLDWETREAAIAASANFLDFMNPSLLPPDQVRSLFRSPKIDEQVKLRVLSDLPRYAAGAASEVFVAIAREALKQEWDLDFDQIKALIAGGATETTTILGLINSSGELIEIDHVHELLQGLGGSYGDLIVPGHKAVVLPNDKTHRLLVSDLKERGYVSTFVTDKKAIKLRVHMRRK